MQDDFGDFHQAPSAMLHQGPSTKQNGNLSKDLNSKILESFDLSGSSQKASIRFQYKPRQMGRRPPSMQYKPSSGAADWKNLDIKTSDFTVKTPVPILQPQKPQILAQPVYPSGAFMPAPNAVQNPRYQHVPGNIPPTVSNYGLPNQMPMQQANDFQNIANSSLGIGITGPYGAFANHPSSLQSFPIQSSNEFPRHSFHSPQTASEMNVGDNSSTLYNFQHQDKTKLNDNMSTSYVASATHGVNNTSDEITLPSWMTKPNDIPQLYKDVLKLCATPNSYADTARLYPILLSSKLPKDVLGHIWSAANQSVPGQLTFSEVYIALGLIALAQKGELNLSVKYVTSLKIAPIPNLDLATTFTETQTAASTVLVMSSKSHSLPNFTATANDDDFADFQSVPPRTEATTFQSFVPSAQPADSRKFDSSVPKCPINTSMLPASYQSSEVKKSTGDLLKSSSVPGTQNNGNLLSRNPNSYNTDLFSSSLTNLKKSDMPYQSEALPVQNRGVSAINHFGRHAPNNEDSGQIAADDFGDFKASVFVSSVDNKTTPVPSLGKTSNPDIFSMPIVETTGFRPIEKHLIGSNDLTDKYSALRGLTPSVPEDVSPESGTLETDDFADFQSMPTQQTNEVAFSSETSSTTTIKPRSVFEKTLFEKEDSTSVSSLELPSLSKTISSLSIGSTSPVKGVEEPFWGFSNQYTDVTASKLANEKGSLETNLTVNSQPNFSDVVVGKPMAVQDDGLYSLDEPISPPSRKKITAEKISHQNEQKIPTFQPKKQVVVPRHVSEPDSDFGDFASGPPPMDDTSDHLNYEFDMFQGGNSSLVDFDAFGHFQEAKEEVKKKPEIRKVREESTAYTEFVASQAVAEKPDTSEIVDDTSVQNSNNSQESKEDWSGFNGRETEQRHYQTINLESEFAAFEDKITSSQRNVITDENESLKDDSFVVKKPWKLESTISDESSHFQTEYSKWDAEGQDMKARMEGTDAISTKELYTDHWGRCLATCKDIIVSTSEILAALNSPSVCHEIVNSKRGKEFISCTSEVYGVSRRICKGMKSVNLSDNDLEQTLKEIEIAWNNLLGFCPYTPSVHKTPEHCSSTPKLEQTEERACGLCLLSIVDSSLSDLEYGGKSYHAPCANLWLNQIAPILPRLDVPSIF